MLNATQALMSLREHMYIPVGGLAHWRGFASALAFASTGRTCSLEEQLRQVAERVYLVQELGMNFARTRCMFCQPYQVTTSMGLCPVPFTFMSFLFLLWLFLWPTITGGQSLTSCLYQVSAMPSVGTITVNLANFPARSTKQLNRLGPRLSKCL